MLFYWTLSVAFLLATTSPAWASPPSSAPPGSDQEVLDYAIFQNPPAKYRGHLMWGYNLSTVKESDISPSIQRIAKEQHFGGLLLVVNGANATNLDEDYVRQAKPFFQLADHGIEYMSDEFFRLYRLAVEQAKQNGLEFILYDDYFYPSGNVCGQLYQKYPQHMAKRLDKVEIDVSGPKRATLQIPDGTYIGAVLMNMDTFERIDVTPQGKAGGRLECDVPPGNWKLMGFYLNHDAVLKIRNPGIVDYLDKEAVSKYIELSYERFYQHLKEYFGSVIKMAFHDEPSMHWLDGRMWTAAFNRMFQQEYGYNPITHYPALWYDIGPQTAAARNALYGFRARLFADAFIRQIDNWCQDHGIQLTGHVDQEEVPNPVPINGDLMKMFEHQAVPGADDIFIWGRSNLGYKVVTSASFNYDKPITMCETYAAYRKLNEKILFQVAMDQYAMGINFQVPVLGWGDERRPKKMVELNEYLGRLSYLLQHGRHVADVAVLYPIASLQSAYTLERDQARGGSKTEPDKSLSDLVKAMGADWAYAYTGGILPPEIDYMNVGEALYRELRMDYTYLHPEVLDDRCIIRNGKLILNNKENREEYRALIVPGGRTLPLSTARKIRDYYRGGGTIIATSRLPHRSAEFGHDNDVQRAIAEVFGVSAEALVRGDLKVDTDKQYSLNRNDAGGRAYFAPKAEARLIGQILKQAIPAWDVEIQEEMWPNKTGEAYDGALTYIHKVKADRDIYFFANSSEKQVSTRAILRGQKDLRIWNPHSGQKEPAQYQHSEVNGHAVTELMLVLPPVTSLFYIQEPASGQ